MTLFHVNHNGIVPWKRPRKDSDPSRRESEVEMAQTEGHAVEMSSITRRASLIALPTELRLMIWEYTWPEPRVIEATSVFDDRGDDEYGEPTILRPLGGLHTVLEIDFTSRIVECSSTIEDCPPPIALRICHESRMHTLKHYIPIQHPSFPETSFYMNLQRDLLWLSSDMTSDYERLEELGASYGPMLDSVQALLVEDTEWEIFWDQNQSTSPILSMFPALRTIVLMALDFEDGSPLHPSALITYDAEEYQKLAVEYRQKYSTFCKSMNIDTPLKIEYIDCQGNFY